MRDWWNKNLDYLPLGARWRGKWQQGQVRRMIREIDERKLDIEIAEKVFGYKVTIVEFSDYDSVMESYYPELAIKIEHKAEEDDYQFDTWIEEIHLPNYSTLFVNSWSKHLRYYNNLQHLKLEKAKVEEIEQNLEDSSYEYELTDEEVEIKEHYHPDFHYLFENLNDEQIEALIKYAKQ